VALPREIPQCTIRPDQAGPQAERWHELARAAVTIDRSPQSLTLAFGNDAPVDTVERVIAVESECCPFFMMSYDADARVLSLSVDEREHAPALDAIAERLGA
jgi:hypothetical protein